MTYSLLKKIEGNKWRTIYESENLNNLDLFISDIGIYVVEKTSFEQGHFGAESKTIEIARYIYGEKVA